MGSIAVEVVIDDVVNFPADILALKYAQDLYGADRAVYNRLKERGAEGPLSLPAEESERFYPSHGSVAAGEILFVGVVELYHFDYGEIRAFARRVLDSLSRRAVSVQHLALTIHGPGYGLDEIEAFQSELLGLTDALSAGKIPRGLSRISFVERSADRAERLQEALDAFAPQGELRFKESPTRSVARGATRSRSESDPAKPLVFVAMPFQDSMHDTFHYGIQNAVRAAGYICERIDQSVFVGDIVQRVLQRISQADLVVADLTGANPNVFLELGFAWGCGRKTVLLSHNTPPEQFDVRGQRCLIYKSIKHLEESLSQELASLSAASPVALR